MSKCSRIKDHLRIHPEGQTTKQIAEATHLPEDHVLITLHVDHEDDFVSFLKPRSNKLFYKLKE